MLNLTSSSRSTTISVRLSAVVIVRIFGESRAKLSSKTKLLEQPALQSVRAEHRAPIGQHAQTARLILPEDSPEIGRLYPTPTKAPTKTTCLDETHRLSISYDDYVIFKLPAAWD